MNRDEFLKRPTANASWRGGLLGGWDLEPGREGGTWLAVDKQGRVGLLTNIYTGGFVDPNAKGRGFMVVNWLKSDMSGAKYLEDLSQDSSVYNPFNLALFEQNEEGEYTVNRYSRGKSGHMENFGPVQDSCGTFGIGNHPQHQPYKKSIWGKEQLEALVKKSSKDLKSCDNLISELEGIMKNSNPHWPDPQIIAQSETPGTKSQFLKYGENLSCVNVSIPGADYGTRTTTVILVDKDDNLTLIEQNHDNDAKRSCYTFNIKSVDS